MEWTKVRTARQFRTTSILHPPFPYHVDSAAVGCGEGSRQDVIFRMVDRDEASAIYESCQRSSFLPFRKDKRTRHERLLPICRNQAILFQVGHVSVIWDKVRVLVEHHGLQRYCSWKRQSLGSLTCSSRHAPLGTRPLNSSARRRADGPE